MPNCKCYKRNDGRYLVYKNGNASVWDKCPNGCEDMTPGNSVTNHSRAADQEES